MEFPTVAKRKVLIDDKEEARKIRERDDVDEILSTEEPTIRKSLKMICIAMDSSTTRD